MLSWPICCLPVGSCAGLSTEAVCGGWETLPGLAAVLADSPGSVAALRARCGSSLCAALSQGCCWRMLSARGAGVGGQKTPPRVWRSCPMSCRHLYPCQQCQPGCPRHRARCPGCKRGFARVGLGRPHPGSAATAGSCGRPWPQQPVLPRGQLQRRAGCGQARGQHGSYRPRPLCRLPGAQHASVSPHQHGGATLQRRGSRFRRSLAAPRQWAAKIMNKLLLINTL